MQKITLVFTHTDLDGIGVKILGIKAAEETNTVAEIYTCNYGDINSKVNNRLDEGIENVERIIIGDISVDAETAQRLDNYYGEGYFELMLVDHHATAEFLNSYSWAEVHEKVEDIERCGTWQLAKKLGLYSDFQTFVDAVDEWDTWKWVESGNLAGKKLNTLLSVVGHDKFSDYILGLYESGVLLDTENMFTEWASSVIETKETIIKKNAKSAEDSMWTSKLRIRYEDNKYDYLTGIVFVNSDISDIAQIILENHPELDILMLVGLPRNISFRTRKNLEVPLGYIAKDVTGQGGGHPQSAGAVIGSGLFKNIFNNIVSYARTSQWSTICLNKDKEGLQ